MPKRGVDFDGVREIALALPDVVESTSRGASSFKVRGRLFACEAISRSAEPGSLVVRVEHSLRDELLATEPEVYYLTAHYENFSSVLVRLARVRREELERLLGIAWLFVSSRAPRPKSKRTRKADTT